MSLLSKLFGATKPTIEIPNGGYGALIAAAMRMSYDLENLLKEAKRTNRIEEADVFQLIDALQLTCRRSKEQYEMRLNENSKDTSTTKWDAEGHARCVKPAALFIAAPDSVVKAAVEAAEKGVTEADILYKYILSELETALRRWQVSLGAALRSAQRSRQE